MPIDLPIENANANNFLNIYLPKKELSLCIEKEETWDSDIRKKIDESHKFYLSIKRFKEEDYV